MNMDRQCRLGLDFPFLINGETREYIQQPGSKVMFIMRGLSGSGKSTIVEAIQSKFHHVSVCSADHFFYQGDGTYAFDVNKLKRAHETSQLKAREACERGVPVVVIDNTNVKRWEMKAYLQTAKVCGYVVVLVEPKTPWKLNARELAVRNKHGVSHEILEAKVRVYEDIIPLYYAWFLSEPCSKHLMDLADQYFKECMKIFPDFQREILQQYHDNHPFDKKEAVEEILTKYYSQGGKTGPLLHCTSHFCNSGRIPSARAYHNNDRVQKSCGQAHSLTISGLTMTKKTFAARVTLDEWGMSIYKRPEEEGWTGVKDGAAGFVEVIGKKNKKKEKASKNKKDLKLATAKARRDCGYGGCEDEADHLASQLGQVSLENEGGIDKEGNAMSLESFPHLHNCGRARSAHITLKTAFQIESKETNFDVLSICDIEQRKGISQTTSSPVLNGEARYYEDGICCVYFREPLVIDALFSGYY